MNFICLQKDILKKIKHSELFLGKNLEHPVLLGVLLRVENNLLTITTTNIESEFKAIIPVKKIEDGELVVSGEILSKIISNSKASEIEFLKNNNVLEINQTGSHVSVNLLEKDDFPEIKDSEEEYKEKFSIDREILRKNLKDVYFASKEQNMKPEMSSILFDFSIPREITLVATDGFRLAEKKQELDKEISFNEKLLIPRTLIVSLLKILDDSESNEVIFNIFENNQIMIEVDSCYIKTRIVDGQFPQYKKLIPVDKKISVILLKQDILDSFDMINVFSDKFDQVVIVIKDNKFLIKSKNEFGNNETQIDAVIDGDEIEMKFVLKHISEVIRNIDSDSFEFVFNESKPLLIRKVGDNTYNYIVMPLRK